MENGFCLDNCVNHPVKLCDIDYQNMDWVATTNGFSSISVHNVINAIGITNEEKRSLIEILCKAARDNNITLEPFVFDLMEQKYVFYGGSKATFGVIARMKAKSSQLKENKENVDVKSKADNMTQGEILLALTPIETMMSICKENCKKPLIGINDVNMIMPFVVKAQKAAEKISRFALDHFNSRDEHKKELSKLICGRFESMLIDHDCIKYNGYKDDTSVDWLNNNIRSVIDILFNTVVACESLVDTLPPQESAEVNNEELKELNRKNTIRDDVDCVKNNKDSVSYEKTIEDEDADESDENYDGDEYDIDDEDEYEGEECYDDAEEAPKIFDSRINENAVIKKIKTLDSEKVPGMRRWYVFYRVFDFLEWLDKPTHSKYIAWVQHHFGWRWQKRDFKGVQSELKKEPNKWRNLVITTKTGKKNKEIGPEYYDFADTIIKVFVDFDDNGMHDKEDFLLDKNKAIIHHNEW